jgi:hypothetical protein
MKLKYILISLFVINTSILANYLETSKKILDITYDRSEEFIYSTSDFLDRSFSAENYEVEQKDLTRAEVYYESVYEDGQETLTTKDIKIRLLFPRLRDKYKVTFENYNTSSSIDDRSSSDDYLLGVANGKRRIGIKFRGIEPDLFVSYVLSSDYIYDNDYNINIGNRAVYFADFGFDNTMNLNISKQLDSSTVLSFDNSYRFQELYDNRHEVVNSLNIYHQLTKKERLNATLSSYATKDDIINQDLEVDYYYAGLSYKNFFYKNRGYFQIDGGAIARDENGFDPKARVLFRIGALFGNSKPKFN